MFESFSEKNISKVSSSYLALFTSLYRARALVNKYEIILIVTGRFSITA